MKSYVLPTLDSEILQATVDKDQFAVRLEAETAALGRLLASFHSGLEEVTLVALPSSEGDGGGGGGGAGGQRPLHVNSFIDPQRGAVLGVRGLGALYTPTCILTAYLLH